MSDSRFVNASNPTWWQQALQDAADRIEHLEAELSVVRDLAYRAGPEGRADALEAIHTRAVRALLKEN